MPGCELIPNTTPSTQNNETDEQGFYKEYIPDNTRVRLMRVMEEMTPILRQEQIIQLARTLGNVFNNTECVPCKQASNPTKHNQFIIKEFLSTKRIEGCSPRTIEIYERGITEISNWMEKQDKILIDMDSPDMRDFIAYKIEQGVGNATCDNYRRFASSFFRWARNEHYTTFNPVDAVKPVKRIKRLKKPLKQIEVHKIREHCNSTRDRAIVELLLSSGIRVAELHGMKKSDVDYANLEFKVIGKGNKERTCYFNDVTKLWLQRYLEERGDDTCPFLWVQTKTYHGKRKQFGIHGIERMIRDTGRRAGVDKVHPHRFRHTFATTALNKGIPIEQVQQLLGHEKLDTTMIYAKVAKEDVKFNHRKLMN